MRDVGSRTFKVVTLPSLMLALISVSVSIFILGNTPTLFLISHLRLVAVSQVASPSART